MASKRTPKKTFQNEIDRIVADAEKNSGASPSFVMINYDFFM